MNHKNIQETFRDNLRKDEMTKKIEKNDKNKYIIRENGWKYAFLSSEWKNAHYLGKVYQFWVHFQFEVAAGSDGISSRS